MSKKIIHIERTKFFYTSSKISFHEILGHVWNENEKKTAFFWLSSRNNHEVHPPKRNLFHVNFNKKEKVEREQIIIAMVFFSFLTCDWWDTIWLFFNKYISFEEELDSKIQKMWKVKKAFKIREFFKFFDALSSFYVLLYSFVIIFFIIFSLKVIIFHLAVLSN